MVIVVAKKKGINSKSHSRDQELQKKIYGEKAKILSREGSALTSYLSAMNQKDKDINMPKRKQQGERRQSCVIPTSRRQRMGHTPGEGLTTINTLWRFCHATTNVGSFHKEHQTLTSPNKAMADNDNRQWTMVVRQQGP